MSTINPEVINTFRLIGLRRQSNVDIYGDITSFACQNTLCTLGVDFSSGLPISVLGRWLFGCMGSAFHGVVVQGSRAAKGLGVRPPGFGIAQSLEPEAPTLEFKVYGFRGFRV